MLPSNGKYMDNMGYTTKVKEVANDNSPFKKCVYAYQAVEAISKRALNLLQHYGDHSPILFVVNSDSTLIVEYDTIVKNTSLEAAIGLINSLQNPFDTRGLVLVSDATSGMTYMLHEKFPCQNCLVIYSEFFNGSLAGRVYPYHRRKGSRTIIIDPYRDIVPEYVSYVSPLPVGNQVYCSTH